MEQLCCSTPLQVSVNMHCWAVVTGYCMYCHTVRYLVLLASTITSVLPPARMRCCRVPLVGQPYDMSCNMSTPYSLSNLIQHWCHPDHQTCTAFRPLSVLHSNASPWWWHGVSKRLLTPRHHHLGQDGATILARGSISTHSFTHATVTWPWFTPQHSPGVGHTHTSVTQ